MASFFQPPRRRLAGFALVRNLADEVLLIEKNDRSVCPERWSLPGGSARDGELVPIACHRLALSQTGLHILPERLLVVHQMPTEDDIPESTSHVFDGGRCFTKITLADDLASYRWVRPEDLNDLLAPYAEWRVKRALDTVHGAPVRYLCGHPRDWTKLAAEERPSPGSTGSGSVGSAATVDLRVGG
jgi:ADP-ribose pyrophosphatase YjhB (NUDIX family)